jgi:hypothetical protein
MSEGDPSRGNSELRDSQPNGLLFGFPQQISLVRHHAPTAGQIEVRSSKHVISYLTGVTPTFVGLSPKFVSTVQQRA